MRKVKDGIELTFYADDGTELAMVTPERVGRSGKMEQAVLALNSDLLNNKHNQPYSERVLPQYKDDIAELLKTYDGAIVTEYLTPNVTIG